MNIGYTRIWESSTYTGYTGREREEYFVFIVQCFPYAFSNQAPRLRWSPPIGTIRSFSSHPIYFSANFRALVTTIGSLRMHVHCRMHARIIPLFSHPHGGHGDETILAESISMILPSRHSNQPNTH